MQGYKAKGADYNCNLDYIDIPILANYYLFPGFAVKAGVQPSFLVRAKYDDENIKDADKKTNIVSEGGKEQEKQEDV